MNESIGSRISKFRKTKGMTQEELAGKMGVSPQAVSKWENDISCPDIGLLPQLAGMLGVTTDELLTGKNDQVKLVPVAQRKSMDELTLRILVHSSDNDNVRINVPLSLVKVCMELGVDVIAGVNGDAQAVKNLDMKKIMELAERGAIGKLMEIETGDGDIVEIVVE